MLPAELQSSWTTCSVLR